MHCCKHLEVQDCTQLVFAAYAQVIIIKELSPSISSYFLEDVDIVFVPPW